VQTTKVPAIASSPGAAQPSTAQPSAAPAGDPEAPPRPEITRPVSRAEIEAVAAHAEPPRAEAAPDGAPRRAPAYPRRLVALIAGLTVAAFVAGFALGLIVH
jgi:hypothetical protein